MKKIFIVFVIIFFHQLIMNQLLLGQGRVYEGPDDPAGDIAAIREGYMTGNRVFLYFKNTTELSDWPKVNVSKTVPFLIKRAVIVCSPASATKGKL